MRAVPLLALLFLLLTACGWSEPPFPQPSPPPQPTVTVIPEPTPVPTASASPEPSPSPSPTPNPSTEPPPSPSPEPLPTRSPQPVPTQSPGPLPTDTPGPIAVEGGGLGPPPTETLPVPSTEAPVSYPVFRQFLTGETTALDPDGVEVSHRLPKDGVAPSMDGEYRQDIFVLLDLDGDAEEELLVRDAYFWTFYDYRAGLLYQLPFGGGAYVWPYTDGVLRHRQSSFSSETYQFITYDAQGGRTQSPVFVRSAQNSDHWDSWTIDGRAAEQWSWELSLREYGQSDPVPPDQVYPQTPEGLESALGESPP